MSLSRSGLLAEIGNAKERILEIEQSGIAIGEQDTRQGLINPLFCGLGWDFSDFSAVRGEFRHPKYNEAADYAFFGAGDGEIPVLLVEAKKLGTDLNNGKIIKQLCSYMGEIGVQWGVLTDGNKYVMYNSNAGISFDDQKFLTLQIKTVDTDDGIGREELADKLIALLSRDALENGEIQKFYSDYAINRQIEDALLSLLSEPFDTLVSAIRKEFKQERVKTDPKLRIGTKHIIAYLNRMKEEDGQLPLSLDDNVHTSEDSVLRSVAALSQQENADISTLVSTKRITVADLLAEGLVTVGANWRCLYKGEFTWGRVTENGELFVNGNTYPSPSAALVEAMRKGQNGWSFWYYADMQGEWCKIDKLRQQYRDRHGLEAVQRRDRAS